jgi:hypothetical protein
MNTTDTPPPLVALASEFGNALSLADLARVVAICGAHRASCVGELPDHPRSVVMKIIRDAKRRQQRKIGEAG